MWDVRGQRGRNRLLAAAVAAVAFVAPLSIGTAQAAGSRPSGPPDHLVQAVTDIGQASRQLSAATGTRFGKVTTSKIKVTVGDQPGITMVTLKRIVSTRGTPYVAFEQAFPAIGPWAVQPNRPQSAISYSVSDVRSATKELQAAGLTKVVTSDSFAYLRATGGLLVQVINKYLMPQGAGSNEPQAGIDFGSPVADSIYPCDIGALQADLSRALGLTWGASQTVTLPWELSDGTTVPLTGTSTISEQTTPFLGTEAPHGFPLEDNCSADYTPHYLTFAANDVAAADTQMADAGMRFVARVVYGGMSLISAYRGAGGVSVMVVSPAFVPQS